MPGGAAISATLVVEDHRPLSRQSNGSAANIVPPPTQPLSSSTKLLTVKRNSLYSIPPPDYKFDPRRSSEKLVWNTFLFWHMYFIGWVSFFAHCSSEIVPIWETHFDWCQSYYVLKRHLEQLWWWQEPRCLKITEKVSFNIASEASYVYILSGQKLIKNVKNCPVWRVFENLKLAVKQCYQTFQF